MHDNTLRTVATCHTYSCLDSDEWHESTETNVRLSSSRHCNCCEIAAHDSTWEYILLHETDWFAMAMKFQAFQMTLRYLFAFVRVLLRGTLRLEPYYTPMFFFGWRESLWGRRRERGAEIGLELPLIEQHVSIRFWYDYIHFFRECYFFNFLRNDDDSIWKEINSLNRLRLEKKWVTSHVFTKALLSFQRG